MALIQSTAIPSGATDYELEQSLKFNRGDSPYLSKTLASAGNRKTWTFSAWVKRSGITTEQNILNVGSGGNPRGYIAWDAGDKFTFHDNKAGSSWTTALTTTALFRDAGAWYHIIVVNNTSQSTEANRAKLYVNGVLQAVTGTYPSQNDDGTFNNAVAHQLGTSFSTTNYLDGYLGEVNFVDGQALTPADFGETGDYGEWKPIEYEGTYGTNGFYLPFKQDYTVEGFSTVTYRGTGTTNYIGGTGFQPDLLWIKKRDGTTSHELHDSVRGITSMLTPNSTAADSDGTDASSTEDLMSFDTDGFTVGTAYHGRTNTSGGSYVAWNWDMGGSNASNTDGSITSTVRANTTYGQSIVTYDGNNGGTVGHGLDSAPNMLIWKQRDGTDAWMVWHSGYGNNGFQQLNTTAAAVGEYSWFMGSTAPSSSVVTMGNGGTVNASGNSYVMYAFHDVTGYSKFGSYTGNASTNAVTTGFAPAFVMLKDTTGSGHSWEMHDSVRGADFGLLANESDAENTSGTDVIDFTDTGFTLKNSNGNLNGSGNTYIYMAFADKREYAYWLDQSGNNNDWTSNNLTESDISVDSPTNNFATMNPLDLNTLTLSEGNLKISNGADAWYAGAGTYGVSTGKWYWEVCATSKASGEEFMVGIKTDTEFDYTSSHSASETWLYYADNGNKYTEGSSASYGSTYDVGDTIGVALDLDSSPNSLTFYKNNVSQGTADTSMESSTTVFMPLISIHGNGTSMIANFGQDSSFAGNKTAQGNQDGNDIGDFYYTPPTGFLALCTKNLPDVAVVPSEHFNTVLYSGNSGTNAVTGVGFQSDFTWLKVRDIADTHALFDSVRGVNKRLYSQATNAEMTGSNQLDSWSTDGFTLGADGAGQVNLDTKSYVAWNWKAGTSVSGNTTGAGTAKTYTGSVNTDNKFSIIKYTGNGTANHTIPHNLGVVPEFFAIKSLEDGENWAVYHKGTHASPETMMLKLNATSANADVDSFLNDVAPTSSVINLGVYSRVNENDETFIAYCWASVDGYSKMGSYTGNDSSDGTFVYTSFAPSLVILKYASGSAGGTKNWHMYDNKRSTYNPTENVLFANESTAESGASAFDVDFLSNGFKLRNAEGAVNNAAEYVYLCFAETPFKYSNAR